MSIESIRPVPLEKSYRLLNHGPTVLVSACHEGMANVMAAAWVCALDFSPPKLTLVLDKQTRTRVLAEQSGMLAVQIPTVQQAGMVHYLGNHGRDEHPDKLQAAGTELFTLQGAAVPLVAGCSAWLQCRLMPEPHNQQQYDLFIAEIVAAWADSRAFRDGHWQFEQGGEAWRSLHYVAGGQFYATGEPVQVTG